MFNFGKYTEAVFVGIIGLIGVIGVTSPRVNDAASAQNGESVIEAQAEESAEEAAATEEAKTEETSEGENASETQTADSSEGNPSDEGETTEAENTETASEGTPIMGIIKPSVDVSRFDGDMATIAGTATPNSTVIAKLANGDEIASTQAGADGQFALVAPFVTPEDGAIINIETVGEGGETITARNAITLLPSMDTDGQTDVVKIDEEGVNLPTGTADLGFSSLEYGIDEPALASGFGIPGSLVDIIIDGVNLGQATVGEDGKWQFEIPSLSEGEHKLELAMNGESALAVDIARNAIVAANETAQASDEQSADENTESVADSASEATEQDSNTSGTEAASTSIEDTRYTVIRGDSLWRIASEKFGEGVRYVDIYNANTDQINNPDLIYPGQELIIRGQ